MADLPEATLQIDESSGALAGGTDMIVVLAAVATNPDITPRVFASTQAILDQHGYAPGVDYCAMHIEETGKQIIFVGLPIVTAGVIGREDTSGNAGGSSVVSAAAAAGGILEECSVVVTCLNATDVTVGTDQVLLGLSLDGGQTTKTIRLGTLTSYTFPFVGLAINLTVGTLKAGAVVYSGTTTAPRWDQPGIQAARTALAGQKKQARSWLVVGDLLTSNDADDVLTEANAYETDNDRFIYARAQIRDRLPQAALSKVSVKMNGAPTLTFAEVGSTGDTVTRSAGSWITDGFAVGDVVTITGSVSNNVTGAIASLSATVLTFGTTDLAAEGPVSGCSVVGSHGLTFAEVGSTGDTVTRSGGSWLADGFRAGDVVTFAGTASNNVTGAIASVSATVLTFGTTDLAAEVIGVVSVTATAGQTKAAWIAAEDAAFAIIDAAPRIDLAAGRATKLSPITGWRFRRYAAWAASIREYQHDVQIPNWRKADGPLFGWGLEDANGNVVEFDERLDGGALAARFTCFRTWANGPEGAFIALSLTRDTDGALLSRTHNMAVANVACSVCQVQTENAIGQVLVLNDPASDGTATATEASLVQIETRVNSALKIALLQGRSEGPRASSAKWTASRQDVLNIAGAELTGTLDLVLNGTLEKIKTRVRVQ